MTRRSQFTALCLSRETVTPSDGMLIYPGGQLQDVLILMDSTIELEEFWRDGVLETSPSSARREYETGEGVGAGHWCP